MDSVYFLFSRKSRDLIEKMAAYAKKHRSRRRVAALNFLSNISLDGTHRDTKLAIFNRRGFPKSAKFHETKRKADTNADEEIENDENQVPNEEEGQGQTTNASTSQQELENDVKPTKESVENQNNIGDSKQNISTEKLKQCVSPKIKGSSPKIATKPEIAVNTVKARTRSRSSASESDPFDSEHVFSELSPTKRHSETPTLSRVYSYSSEREKNFSRKRLLPSISLIEASIGGHYHDETTQDQLGLLVTRERSRHRSGSLSTESSESTLPRKEVRFLKPREKVIKSERVVLLSELKVPFAVFSNLSYSRRRQQGLNSESESSRTRRISGSTRPLSANYGPRPLSSSYEGLLFGLQAMEKVEEGQDISFCEFLVPSRVRAIRKYISLEGMMDYECDSPLPSPETKRRDLLGLDDWIRLYRQRLHASPAFLRSFSFDPSVVQNARYSGSVIEKVAEQNLGSNVYDPNALDDPELRSGKHRTLMTFPSYMTSVIDYVKPSDLKRDLNEQFKERFPHVNITLSKLRSLKKDLKKIVCKISNPGCCMDNWVVAQSYVYFEKLILNGLISKQNRKLVASACLLLSAKLNDAKGSDLSNLLQEIETTFKVHRRDMLAFEFAALVALEFSLHIPDYEVYPHYQRLIYQT